MADIKEYGASNELKNIDQVINTLNGVPGTSVGSNFFALNPASGKLGDWGGDTWNVCSAANPAGPASPDAKLVTDASVSVSITNPTTAPTEADVPNIVNPAAAPTVALAYGSSDIWMPVGQTYTFAFTWCIKKGNNFTNTLFETQLSPASVAITTTQRQPAVLLTFGSIPAGVDAVKIYCVSGPSLGTGTSQSTVGYTGIIAFSGTSIVVSTCQGQAAAPGSNTCGGALAAGTYAGTYTYVNAAGETLASSASAGVVVGVNDAYTLTIKGIPTGVPQVNFYLTSAPSGNLGLFGSVVPYSTLGQHSMEATAVLTSNSQPTGVTSPGVNTTGSLPANRVSSASANFTVLDLGKIFGLATGEVGTGDYGPTTDGNPPTITAIVNSTTVTMSANAGASVMNGRFVWGTDNRTRIQAAIDAANAAGGGVVLVPQGSYLLSYSGTSQGFLVNGERPFPALIIRSNVGLLGTFGGSILYSQGNKNGGNVTMINEPGDPMNGGSSGWSIRGLVFDGNNTQVINELNHRVLCCGGASNWKFLDNEVRWFGGKTTFVMGGGLGGGTFGATQPVATNVVISRNYVHDGASNAFGLNGMTDLEFSDNQLYHIRWSATSESIIARGLQRCSFVRNRVIDWGNISLAGSGWPMQDVIIADNICRGLWGTGGMISLVNARRCTVSGNLMDGTALGYTGTGGSGAPLNGACAGIGGTGNLSEITIADNVFQGAYLPGSVGSGAGQAGIAIQNVASSPGGVNSRITVRGNIVRNADMAMQSLSHSEISGNYVDGCMYIPDHMVAVKVRGNTFLNLGSASGSKDTRTGEGSSSILSYNCLWSDNYIQSNGIVLAVDGNGHSIRGNTLVYTGNEVNGIFISESTGAYDNIISENRLVGGSANRVLLATNSTSIVKDNLGYNPQGKLAAPAVPATGVVQANTFGVPATVHVTGGTVTVIALGINTPVNLAFSTATTGGTLADSTAFYYRVAAVAPNTGVTLASTETTVTTGVSGGNTNKVTVNWLPVPGATSYKIYGRATGAELLMATVSHQTLTTWVDDGSITPAGALPASNTTGVTTGLTAGTFHLEPGMGILITYSVVPTWTWFGD